LLTELLQDTLIHRVALYAPISPEQLQLLQAHPIRTHGRAIMRAVLCGSARADILFKKKLRLLWWPLETGVHEMKLAIYIPDWQRRDNTTSAVAMGF
jgi:hypothetical protein